METYLGKQEEIKDMNLLIGRDMWGTTWVWEEQSTNFMQLEKINEKQCSVERRTAADCISFIGRVVFKVIPDKDKEIIHKMWNELYK